MIYRTDTNRDEIIASDLQTEHLVTLALGLPVVDGRSELYGRSHAYYSIGHTREAALEYVNGVGDDTRRRHIAARALALAGYAVYDVRSLTDRITRRRPTVPGSDARLYRYADTCANCGNPIVGELTGILATGESISWRHRDGFAFGCGRRVDRDAAQAIPADEVDGTCSVHRAVTRWHHCESGGTIAYALVITS